MLLAFGPIFASRPTQTWLLSTPVKRRMLLSYKFSAALLLAAFSGTAVAIFFLSIVPSTGHSQLFPLAAGMAIGVTQASTAILIQRRSTWTRTAQRILNVIISGIALVAAIALFIQPDFSPFQNDITGTVLTLVFVISLTVAVAAAAFAFGTLGRLTRASLSSGIDIATATSVSVSFLDPSILSSILVERRARAIGRVRSVRIRGGRIVALLMVDWTRIRRMRLGIVIWCTLVPVPYTIGAIGLSGLLPAAHLLTAFLATARLAMGLRFVCHSNAIRRALGGTDRELRLTHLIIPTIGAITWCSLTMLLTPGITALTALLSAVGSAIVIYRVATRPSLDYAAPAYNFGLAGPTPVGLIIQLSRGPAMLIFLSWLQIMLAN
jgi:Family of unknown function (DUF6297)